MDKSTIHRYQQIFTPSYSGGLSVAENYTKTISFMIPDKWPSGNYSIQLACDFRNYVFESNYTANNLHSIQFHIEQKLPDLILNNFEVDAYINTTSGDMVFNMTIVVTNKGSADAKMFADKLDVYYEKDEHLQIVTKFHRNLLRHNETKIYNTVIMLNRVKSKSAKLILTTNYLEDVYEKQKQNNIFVIENINLPIAYDNISLTIVEFKDSKTTILEPTAGSQISISIKYNNNMNLPTKSSWVDKLYLLQNEKQYFIGSFKSQQLNSNGDTT